MKLIRTISLVSLSLLLGISTLSAKEFRIAADRVAATLKGATAGDRIVILNGTYNDLRLEWRATGTESAPIRIEAETPGGVIFSGSSTLHFAGEWLEIDGLSFSHGCPPDGSNTVIEFRCKGDVANHCRLTRCAVSDYNPARRDIPYSHVLLYGRHNRVDHCTFADKLNLGVTLIVMLNEERSQQNYHRIDHNHFAPRPVYGSNGAETIRVGTSQQAYKSSNTIIEDNLFDRCDGEVEVVSIKSSDNIIRNNTFYHAQGVLALRHGDRNRAEGNIFLGDGIRNTGGIRIVNAGHTVKGNIFKGVVGTRFFSALAVMNAVPNSLPNRYCLVKDVEITDNLFIDCSNIEFGTGKDLERTLAPEDVLFARNTIINKELSEPFITVDDTSGFTFQENNVQLGTPCTLTGFTNVKKFKMPALPDEKKLTEGVGAEWYRADEVMATANNKVYQVHAGEDLAAVVDQAEAGSTVELTDAGGDYAIGRALTVRTPLTIRAAATAEKRPVIRFNGRKGENMITIADGADLTVAGICFSGELEPGKALAKAGISTADKMIRPYNLYIDNCEFTDFGEGGFFAVKGTQGTFAGRVEIRNSLFRNLSGDAIYYAAERDDKGRYNADDMIIENCAFHRILGLPINIYRGGSDESTAGPYVSVLNCNFEDCCNKERGSVVRLIGPQVLEIKGCNFSNSGRGGAAIRLDEATWEVVSVSDCNFYNSGRIISMTDNAVKGGMHHEEPQYVNLEALDFRQKAGSTLATWNIGIPEK